MKNNGYDRMSQLPIGLVISSPSALASHDAALRGKKSSNSVQGFSNNTAILERMLVPVIPLGRANGNTINEKKKRYIKYHRCIPIQAKFPPRPYRPSK